MRNAPAGKATESTEATEGGGCRDCGGVGRGEFASEKGAVEWGIFAYVRLCSPMFAFNRKKSLRRRMVNAVQSCRMHDKRRWGLVELAPPSTRGNVWRGRTSISRAARFGSATGWQADCKTGGLTLPRTSKRGFIPSKSGEARRVEGTARAAPSSPASPREERVGRGPRRGETNRNAPPLPGPLLHPMEEREKSRSLMQP